MTDINRISKLIKERKGTTLERMASVGFEYVGCTLKPFIEVYENDKVYLFYNPTKDKVTRLQLK